MPEPTRMERDEGSWLDGDDPECDCTECPCAVCGSLCDDCLGCYLMTGDAEDGDDG